MATQFSNRVVVSTATTGTGTINLGSAVGTFLSFTVLTTGSTVGYAIDDVNGGWEVGTGVYTSGSPGTLTRVVETSTNSNTAISLSGSAQVAIAITSAQMTALATTAAVAATYAPLASPALTGTPTAPTAAATDNSTTVATTAFVQSSVLAGDNIGRNKIHNPLMNIAQRGTGAFTSNGVYTLDRWLMSLTGDTVSITQAALADADRTAIGDEEAEFALQNIFTGLSGAGNNNLVVQRIEDVKRLSNKTVTVSFWAKAATGTPKLGFSLDQGFGSGGSSAVTGTGQAFTLSTTWTRYSGTFTLGSASGKTIGAGSYTQFNFWFSAGSTFNSRSGSIGTQSGTYQIWGTQLEIGSVATQLEKPDPRFDLSNCQRFYTIGAILASSTGTTSSTLFAQSAFPVTMRATPTIVGTNNSSSNVTSPNAVNSSAYPTGAVIGTGTCTASGAYQLNVTYTSSADL